MYSILGGFLPFGRLKSLPKWPSGWATPVDLEAQDFPLHQGNAFNEQQKGCLDRTSIFGWLFANIIVKN